MAKRKSFADDGWAIWVTGEDTSTFYLNEWVNPQGKSYVDVSVRIRGVKGTHSLNVYIPFVVEKTEVEDLSHFLHRLYCKILRRRNLAYSIHRCSTGLSG